MTLFAADTSRARETLKEFILKKLKSNKAGMSCTELAEYAINYGLVHNYASKSNITASFSSILSKLIKEGKVKLSNKKAIRGGNIYIKSSKIYENRWLKSQF
jgi:hypothetical protein